MSQPFFDESPTIGCPDCGGESYTPVSKYCTRHWRDNWHLWFAWYPVLTLEGVWKWGSFIIRKPIPKDYKPLHGYKRKTIYRHWYRTWDS